MTGVSDQDPPIPIDNLPEVVESAIDGLVARLRGLGQDTPAMSQLVEDLEERRAWGIEKYGQELFWNTGRNLQQDMYEELLDAAVYSTGMVQMSQHERGTTAPQPNEIGAVVQGYVIGLLLRILDTP